MELKKPDMRYKFNDKDEPTDEQLAWIMKEVGDDAREQSKRAKEIIKQQIKEAIDANKKRFLA